MEALGHQVPHSQSHLFPLFILTSNYSHVASNYPLIRQYFLSEYTNCVSNYLPMLCLATEVDNRIPLRYMDNFTILHKS